MVNDQTDGGISWTDVTINPITGCDKKCPYCYAEKIYKRFGMSFEPTFHPERLEKDFNRLSKIKEKKRVFVGSTSDVFGSRVESSWRTALFDKIKSCPQHDFLFLTKQINRMIKFALVNQEPNVIYGISLVDNSFQKFELMKWMEIKRRFISFEPLLAPVFQEALMYHPCIQECEQVIIGSQTNPDKSIPKEAFDQIVTYAKLYNVPVHYKKNCIVE